VTATPTATVATENDARAIFLAKYGKFLVVGLTGVVVNLIVFAVTLDALSPSPTFNLIASLLKTASSTSYSTVDTLLASVIAFAVATLWNFTFNNLWTFRTERGHHHVLAHRVGLYYGISLGSLAVNEVILFVASHYVPPLYGQGAGILVGSIVGFLGNSRITFAEREFAE
jgi:putative flippase GtrA